MAKAALGIAGCGLLLALHSLAAAGADSLAPTGTLRVAFLAGNPVQGRVDAATGAITGPVADLTQELARRLGVPFRIVPSQGVRAVLDSVENHAADIGFLAFDATRANEVDFSQPYALAYNSYIVPAGSSLRSAKDIDRAGVRVAAAKGDSGELYLMRTLKQAELKSIAGLNPDTARKMLLAGEIDAYAANRQRLAEMAARFPGLRLLPDNFFAVQQSLIVAKGNATAVRLLNQFIDTARSSGFLRDMIGRAGLNGVEVASAAKTRDR
jgi:polar amino acid transport system substrate-binding protein